MSSPFNLLTVTEAAELLGISRARMSQFCSEGRIGQKVGGRWLVSEDELRQFRKIPRPTGRPATATTPCAAST